MNRFGCAVVLTVSTTLTVWVMPESRRMTSLISPGFGALSIGFICDFDLVRDRAWRPDTRVGKREVTVFYHRHWTGIRVGNSRIESEREFSVIAQPSWSKSSSSVPILG